MYTMRIITAVFCIAISACGGGDPAIQIPLQKLEINSSFPSDGEKNVPIKNSQIIITPSLPLDPASVNSFNVHLMPGEGNDFHEMIESIEPDEEGKMDVIPGQVSYNPINNIITFTPSNELKHGVTYHLRVHNVKLKDGTPLEDGSDTIQFSFTTAHQILVEQTNFYQSGESAGTISSRAVHTYSLNGNLEKITYYKADNKVSFITRYNDMLPSGTIAKLVNYGSDGVTVRSYKNDVIDELGNIVAHVTYTGAGKDETWGTADDLFQSFSDHNHEHSAHRLSSYYVIKDIYRNQDIRAGTWAEKDELFEAKFLSLLEHRGSVFAHRQIYYSSRGIDGLLDFNQQGDPQPIDDLVALWYKRDFDQQTGLRTIQWVMKGNITENTDPNVKNTLDPAKNAVLFTQQNEVISMRYYTYKPSTTNSLIQLPDKIYIYKSAGADNNWEGMIDNELERTITFEYDQFDYLSKQSTYTRNSDGEDILIMEKTYRNGLQ